MRLSGCSGVVELHVAAATRHMVHPRITFPPNVHSQYDTEPLDSRLQPVSSRFVAAAGVVAAAGGVA